MPSIINSADGPTKSGSIPPNSKYLVVQTTDPSDITDLIRTVDRLIDDGWKAAGGIEVSVNTNRNMFFQAMVRS